MLIQFSYSLSLRTLIVLSVISLFTITPLVTKADTQTTQGNAAHVLQEALATRDRVNLYDGEKRNGLNISGGLFSGRASGIDTTAKNYLSNSMSSDLHFDNTAELEGDQRVYALIIDGNYIFHNNLGSGLPLHPYMSGGIGMAMYDRSGAPITNNNPSLQNGNMVPLFRVGGGVSYQLGKQWDMSLDYKAGFTGGSDPSASNRSQLSADTHVLNMGMHYQF